MLTCKIRGFITLHHNDIANVTSDIPSMISKAVRKEPTLSTTPESNDELRADISVRSFWQRLQMPFVGVGFFYPIAPSHQNQSLAKTMKAMEN